MSLSSKNQEIDNRERAEPKKRSLRQQIKEMMGKRGYYLLVSSADRQPINSILDDLKIDHEIWGVYRARAKFGLKTIPSGYIAFVFNISEENMEQLKVSLSKKFSQQIFTFHPST